jgi:ATP-binding cassette subfamily C protein
MIFSFFRLMARCYRMALPYGRLKLFGVLGLILFNGLLQLVGVSSVFPFFALAAAPDRIRNSKIGGHLLHYLPPMSTNHLLVLAGCFAIAMLVFASVGSLLSENLRIRYAYGFCHWLRGRLFESYASQPYAFFLRRNTAELNQRLNDIMTFIQSVLLPIGEILTRLVLVLLLLGGMIFVQPWVALGAVLVFGGFYLLAFLWLRPRARAVGEGMWRHNLGFAKNTSQFLQGIKTVLVHGKTRYFMDRALEHSARIGYFQSKIPIYGNGPRYMIEPVAFGGLMAIVVVLAFRGRPFSDILPNLSVMAFAGYKLLPALQLLYSQLVTVAANQYTLAHLETEILNIEKETGKTSSKAGTPRCGVRTAQRDVPTNLPAPPLAFDRELRLEQIGFHYPAATTPVLKDFSIVIAKNESVGIAGPSGSGKSTLVDLILGLHVPQTGVIRLDGEPLTADNMASWRRMIGYVPQDIYLLDDTIEANIAFGVDAKDVDRVALREAALGAQILDFIEKELPQGMQTGVGERGARLSGGQRQRIGLARALYHRPQVLILDEATSALDHQTERAVMETIHRLQGTLTIITIAHRLSTLERCDRIIRLEGGKIVEKKAEMLKS